MFSENVNSMSDAKQLKLTPAGQQALKNIAVAPAERELLEQFLQHPERMLPPTDVAIPVADPELLNKCIQRGWVRWSVGLPLRSPAGGVVERVQQRLEEAASTAVSPVAAPAVVPPVVPPVVPQGGSAAERQPEQAPVVAHLEVGVEVQVPVFAMPEVSEEEIAQSYENFLNVMGKK